MSVRAIPEGYHTITPAITCKNAARAIDFYKKALGAKETERMAGPDGKVMHAEMKIGDSVIFLSDEFPDMTAGPAPGALPSNHLFLYVEDVDKAFNQAVAAGCQPSMAVTDMFWGDRYGKVVDPFGHHWGLATHKEDVPRQEMERRAQEWMANIAKKSKAAGRS